MSALSAYFEDDEMGKDLVQGEVGHQFFVIISLIFLSQESSYTREFNSYSPVGSSRMSTLHAKTSAS